MPSDASTQSDLDSPLGVDRCTSAAQDSAFHGIRTWALNNPEFMAELLVRLIEHLPEDCQRLVNAVENRNSSIAAAASHKLRGLVATMGLDALAGTVSQIEADSDTNKWIHAASECQRLEHDIHKLLAEANELVGVLHASRAHQPEGAVK